MYELDANAFVTIHLQIY